MRLFKRISSTVLSSVDKVVGEIENHDAVVESMLKDLNKAAAETKVRLKRVNADGSKMREQLKKLSNDEKRWQTRAQGFSAEDENKALACLERRERCREELARLQEMLQQHTETEKRLLEQVKTIEKRHAEIGNKRHLLQSRQSVAEANRVVSAVVGSGSAGVNDAFDRWEVSIAKSELSDPYANYTYEDYDALEDIDRFELEIVETEKKQNLLSELEKLKTLNGLDDEPSNSDEENKTGGNHESA